MSRVRLIEITDEGFRWFEELDGGAEHVLPPDPADRSKVGQLGELSPRGSGTHRWVAWVPDCPCCPRTADLGHSMGPSLRCTRCRVPWAKLLGHPVPCPGDRPTQGNVEGR